MGYYVGAYAASPCWTRWDPSAEADFHAGLRELEDVEGLEHPFFGSLHKWDDRWFLEHLDPRWSFLFTCIPGTMDGLAKDPRFGLASDDESSRKAALAFTRAARDAAARLNDALKRPAVTGIALHSAPRRGPPGVSSSRRAFAESLSEMLRWDWLGAKLLVEHCDALVPDHAPDKGFLSLDDELAAVAAAGAGRVKMLVNWGRSAVEARGARGPVEHIRSARGRLGGLIFSGCTEDHPLYGRWRDGHAPFAPAFGAEEGEPASLLTARAVGDCLAAAEGEALDFLGFKIKPLPAELPVPRRLAFLRSGIQVLEGCRSGLRRG